MASLSKDSHGGKRIQFTGGDGKRRAVRLGQVTIKQAEAFRLRVERLVAASITRHPPDDETLRWVMALDDKIHRRLAAVGLVTSRDRDAATLGSFMVNYFASLDVKASTAIIYGHTRKYLLEFFGETRSLRSIEPLEAEKWKQHLKKSGIASTTIGRRVIVARSMFKRAMKWKLITENPFQDVVGGSQRNKSRMFFVTREATDRVLAQCPNAEWRLLIALSRYGGLRCPSEHLMLEWSCVDWERGRIKVFSPKTEHHPGGAYRTIPLYPELKPFLLDVYEQAEPGSKFIITRYRRANQNLRTELLRLMGQAGVEPWPKLFHNMRSSRQTELADAYPIQVVCEWMGNSETVARENYLQMLDAHFERAALETSEMRRTKPAQNQAQQGEAAHRNGSQTDYPAMTHPLVLPEDATPCEAVRQIVMGAEGFEPSKA